MPLEMTSSAVEAGNVIQQRYCQAGEDISPPLKWQGEPEGTKSFAVLMDGPSEEGELRNYWILYNLPASHHELPEHVAPQDTLTELVHDGISPRQGKNDLGQVGYCGPVLRHHPPYSYTFTLYALDCDLHVPPGSPKDAVLGAMADHVLDQAELTTLYTP